MHPTDTNFQKLTGEWNKHIRKRKDLKKLYNKKRRAFLKEIFNKENCQNTINGEVKMLVIIVSINQF